MIVSAYAPALYIRRWYLYDLIYTIEPMLCQYWNTSYHWHYHAWLNIIGLTFPKLFYSMSPWEIFCNMLPSCGANFVVLFIQMIPTQRKRLFVCQNTIAHYTFHKCSKCEKGMFEIMTISWDVVTSLPHEDVTANTGNNGQ